MEVLSIWFCVVFGAFISGSFGTRPYEMKIDRLENDNTVVDRHFDFSKLITKKFNRTTMVINGTVNILKPIPTDSIASIKASEWVGNAYRETIHVPDQKVCDFIESEKWFIPQLAANSRGSWNGKCPIDMKAIHIYDMILDEDQFPEDLPGSKWLFYTTVSYKSKTISGLKLYVTIDRVNALRKKEGPMG